MKYLRTIAILLATGTATLFATQPAFAQPDARSLRDVETVWVDSNSCNDGISAQLRERGFFCHQQCADG